MPTPQNSAQSDSGFRLCLDAAYRFLSLRPRSEFEVRTRLKKKGHTEASIGRAIAELKRQGVLDDSSFARFWTENRESFSPRGRALLTMELRSKGIDPGIVTEVLQDLNEEESAYRAACKRAKRSLQLEYEDFRNLMASFLRRRGFGYEVSQRVLNRLWNEEKENA